MNYTKDTGWYYNSANDRAAAWTSVFYLHKFLINNKGIGPYAEEVDSNSVKEGDIVQLGDINGNFYHSPVIIKITASEIYVAAHSVDSYMRPLSSYPFKKLRFIHILGVRTW